jgi:hypothetical protein
MTVLKNHKAESQNVFDGQTIKWPDSKKEKIALKQRALV